MREVALKTHAHGWLVGRVSGSREFFSLFPSSVGGMAEVYSEVQALGNVHFANIFNA